LTAEWQSPRLVGSNAAREVQHAPDLKLRLRPPRQVFIKFGNLNYHASNVRVGQPCGVQTGKSMAKKDARWGVKNQDRTAKCERPRGSKPAAFRDELPVTPGSAHQTVQANVPVMMFPKTASEPLGGSRMLALAIRRCQNATPNSLTVPMICLLTQIV
jgi:hypothetical protein